MPSPRGSAAFGQLSTAQSSQQSETITFSKSTGISAGVCTGLEIVGIQRIQLQELNSMQSSVFFEASPGPLVDANDPPTGVLHQVKLVKLFIQLHYLHVLGLFQMTAASEGLPYVGEAMQVWIDHRIKSKLLSSSRRVLMVD